TTSPMHSRLICKSRPFRLTTVKRITLQTQPDNSEVRRLLLHCRGPAYTAVMKFTKMHGLGNCYVYVNCFEEQVADPPALARAMSDRNTGVGSDGLILIRPSDKADARMEMYNIDGSRGQMCGNGIRCVAKYVYDHNLSRSNPMSIETDAGVLTMDLTLEDDKVQLVQVDMGTPRLRPQDMPTTLAPEQLTDHELQLLGRTVRLTCVSMGNPHVVVYGVPLDELTPARLAEEGRFLETHPI